MWRIVTILLLLLKMNYVHAQQPILLNGQPDWKAGIDIANHTLVFEEISDTALSLSAIQQKTFLPFKESDYRYAKTPRIVQWLKFIVANTNAMDTIHLILNLNTHYFLQLYQQNILLVTKGTSIKNNMADRVGLHLTVPPQATYIYYAKMEERIRYLTPFFVRLETAGTYFSWLNTQFYQERWLRFILPIMAGILLLAAVFGLYQFYLIRDKAFLYYFIYALCSFAICFYWMDDRLHLSVLSESATWFCDSFLLYFILPAYLFFVNGVLNIAKHFPRLWLVLKCLLAITIIQAIINFAEYVSNQFLFRSYAYYAYLQGIPAILITAILFTATIKSRSPVKRFIAAGLSFLIAFFFLPFWAFFFSNFHHLPYEIASIANYGPTFFIFGITLEAICFAFALAYRTKLVTEEKNNLQIKYTAQLEQELKIRTDELHQQNEMVEAQKIKQLQTEFEQKIAETEMTALRAQMNPHFIFNCLNSIKLYTLENDSETASDYLTKFSQLIRLVLENSRSEKVTLEKELETLTLYIEMEAMRFKRKVQYRISVDADIDAAYIEIPPLLIQPYVENAIWHGLMHKKEGGIIHLNVSMASEHLLRIEIKDDGVGRAAAQDYKSKSVTRQKSFGMKMTSERIGMINHVYHTNTEVNIIDEYDAMNEPCGTRVIIEIPI